MTPSIGDTQRRDAHRKLNRYQHANRTFWLATLVAAAAMLAPIDVPVIATFFGTGPLDLIDWACVGAAAVMLLGRRDGGRVLRSRGVLMPAHVA